MNVQNAARQLIALSACLTGLWRSHVPVGEIRGGLASPRRWVAQVGADAVAYDLAVAVVWCACAWLSVGLIAAVLTRLPGEFGDLARRLCALMLPGALRRVLGISLGVTLTLAPIQAGAATPTGIDAVAVARSNIVPLIPAPRSPHDQLRLLRTAPSIPVRTAPSDHSIVGEYHVRAGDSLWQISRSLHPESSDAEVSKLWRVLYDINRRGIGPNPDRLVPGQTLRLPQPEDKERHT